MKYFTKISEKSEKNNKALLLAGLGLATAGVGLYLKRPRSTEAAKRFAKNVGKNPVWYASDDGIRLKSLGKTIETESRVWNMNMQTKPVKDIKKGEELAGGFFGHRGDMSKNFPTNRKFNEAKLTGKIYDTPKITKDLEDNWKWYNLAKGDGVPKTILGSHVKDIKDVENLVGKDYIVKSRIGWGGKGIISSKDFIKTPEKYLNSKHVIQKKEQLAKEYRVLVGEGKSVYVIPRKGGEFVLTPTPHLAAEKDLVARKAEQIVNRMSKHKNELHSLDMGITNKGKIITWEDNAAQGGNMFIRGESHKAFKKFLKGKSMPTYKNRLAGNILLGTGALATSVGTVTLTGDMSKQ